MLTITNVLKNLIEENLELSHIWNKKLLNLTALAKELKPEIDKRLDVPTELSSIVVSLNRLSKTWVNQQIIPKIEIKNIQIIKNITTLVYARNPAVIPVLMKIKDKILEIEDVFITHEIDRKNILFSTESEYLDGYLDELDELGNFKRSQNDRLVAVIFELKSYFDSRYIDTVQPENFIHYSVLHKLAESNIPVVRMRSCQNQFVFLIEDKYLEQIYKLWQL